MYWNSYEKGSAETMIDTIKKIYYGDDGDFVEVTLDSIDNFAILLGNQSIRGNSKTVIYKHDVADLIQALQILHDDYL